MSMAVAQLEVPEAHRSSQEGTPIGSYSSNFGSCRSINKLFQRSVLGISGLGNNTFTIIIN